MLGFFGLCSGYSRVPSKNVSPFGPAVRPAIGNIHTNDLFYYTWRGSGVFNIQSLFLSVVVRVVNILCYRAFFTIRGPFSVDILYKIMLEPEKKFKKRKSSNGSTLFPVLF